MHSQRRFLRDMLTPVSDGSLDRSDLPVTPGELPNLQRDAALLDAYSQAVIGVVERVGPAVISVGGPAVDGRGGMGSGFLISSDGFALTNSHVAQGRRQLRTADGLLDRAGAQGRHDPGVCPQPAAHPATGSCSACTTEP